MKLPLLLLVLGGLGLTASLHGFREVDAKRADDIQSCYYASGRIEMQSEYHDGLREGPSQRFYADGKLMAQGLYRAGRMEGAWSWYLPDGSPDAQRSGQYYAGARLGD